ncbi:MAG: nucleotidyl transferase AbiEii/AbiGii toxin family protein [Candidatus Omnitrophota bacterium]
MEKDKILGYQSIVLKALSGKIDDFYLAGGTALSLFYFQHRLSIDLDFFTPNFSNKQVEDIIACLKISLKKNIKLTAQSLTDKRTKMMVYRIHFSNKDDLKIDFVEDVFPLIKQPKNIEEIKVLSLEDIYLRKIYAIVGALPILNEIGKTNLIGGRIEAKDFYDLYFLSHTFMPLSRFAEKYGNPMIKEGLISWFRAYDRMNMIDGVLTLEAAGKINYKSMEKHFSGEIDKIIETEVESL